MLKKYFFLLIFIFPGLLLAQNNDSDHEIHTIEGAVISRLGVFFTLSVDNWLDIEEMPFKKDTGNVLIYTDKKISEDLGPGWVPLLKATVHHPKHDHKTLELKILEDFAEKVKKLGLGNVQLEKGLRLRFSWKVKTY